jgi:galactofuranosylgalactofuranosylrhamnosyl-N-acetylglucosaminyl-diphospho-decaprenol beta-1,5/1,6-galactofuranosyltransferase
MICLQHFLFTMKAPGTDDLWIQCDAIDSLTRNDREITAHIAGENAEGTIFFDGIGNAFPVESFARHTVVSHVRLKGDLEGEIALQILHVRDGQRKVLHEEPFLLRQGAWESPLLPLVSGEGRFVLSCRARGKVRLGNLGWWCDTVPPRPLSFLASLTIYHWGEPFLKTIRDLLAYSPLKDWNLSFLIVDNSQTFSLNLLPEDSRLTLRHQPNLGGTGGGMRGLCHARATGADYLVTIADEEMLLHPEIFYRMLGLQSLSNTPMAVGSMMVQFSPPNILGEQGSLVPKDSDGSMRHRNTGMNLSRSDSFGNLYREQPCNYLGWWLMSAPVSDIPFLPAFFLHYDDIMQGLLLEKTGIPMIAPPHLFIWQDLGNNLSSYRAFVTNRNKLAMLLILDFPLSRFRMVRGLLSKILESLVNFDYDLAGLHLFTLREATLSASWTLDPLGGSEQIQKIRRESTPRIDLSPLLSRSYLPAKVSKRSRSGTILQILFYYLTLAGYLNPFARSLTPDGGMVYRDEGDYDAWQRFGYRQVAVIDPGKKGYVCQRSWPRMLRILSGTFTTLLRFLWSFEKIRKDYQATSKSYEKMWQKTFETIDEKNKPRD